MACSPRRLFHSPRGGDPYGGKHAHGAHRSALVRDLWVGLKRPRGSDAWVAYAHVIAVQSVNRADRVNMVIAVYYVRSSNGFGAHTEAA